MVFRKIILIDSWVGVLYVSKSTVQNEPIRWLYSFRGECICHKGGFYSNELGSCTTNCDEGQVPDKLNNEWRCLKCKNGIVVNHMCTCPSQLAKLNLDGDECVCTDGTESFNGACVRKRLRFFEVRRMTYYIWVKERNLWCFSLIFTRCQNGKINAHGTCICNENFEEGSLGVCVPIVVPELIPDNEQRTGCAEGYKWNRETAKCEIMVAGFSFIGEFCPITESSANQQFQNLF